LSSFHSAYLPPLTPTLPLIRLKAMKIIGLTGNIGSGKSTVSALMKELGAKVLDSDKMGHEVFNPGTPGWQETIAAFGPDILTPEETIDRKKLAQIVFRDPAARLKLNEIVHPKVEEAVRKALKAYQEQGVEVAMIETALIENVRWTSLADQIWVVKTAPEITVKRLKERGMSEPESRARMASQTPPEDHIQHGLVIINNDGNLEELRAKVHQLWQELQLN
jgi:dephospho-CoA kinase